MIFPNVSAEEWIANHPGLKIVESSCPMCARKVVANKPFIDKDYYGLTSSPCPCGNENAHSESMVTRTGKAHRGWLEAIQSKTI